MQKGLKNLDAAGKNVLDASKNVDALMGGFMKKGLNVNVKDAKNVMNAVSVSVKEAVFRNSTIFCRTYQRMTGQRA